MKYKVIILNKGTVYSEKTTIENIFKSTNGLSQSSISNIEGAELKLGKFFIEDKISANGVKTFTFDAQIIAGQSGTGTSNFSIVSYEADYRCPKLKSSIGVGKNDVIYLQAGEIAKPTLTPKPIISTSEISRSTSEQYRLTKSSNKSEVYAGDEIEFTISIKNTGEQDLKNVMLFDIFPKEYLEPVGNSAKKLVDPETLKFKRKFLPQGDVFTATVKMKVKSHVLAGTTITNILKAGSQTIEMKKQASVQIKVLAHEQANISPKYIPKKHIASLIGPVRLVQTGLEMPIIPIGLFLFFAGVIIYRRKIS